MDAPKCRICGERHYGICATKSTAARKDVPGLTPIPTDREARPDKPVVRTVSAAGTQAPPVDTNRAHGSQSGRVGAPSPALLTKQPDEPKGETERSLRSSQAGSVGGAGQTSIRKGDRHKPGYMAKYMRAYRARLKARG